MEVCLAGGDLDERGHVELEHQLAHSPDDLELRIKRLGFLCARQLPFGAEVLWLVTHHPDVDLGAFALFSREKDPEHYDPIRLAWKGLVERSPENSVYREQAARFASLDDPDYAEAL